jgi:hypothetical protein
MRNIIISNILLLLFCVIEANAQISLFSEPEMQIAGRIYAVTFSKAFKNTGKGSFTIWNKANTLMHLPENPNDPDMINYPCTPYTEDEDDWDISERTHYAEMDFLQKAFIKVWGEQRIRTMERNTSILISVYVNKEGKVKEVRFLLDHDFPIKPTDIPALEDEIKKMEFSIDPLCKSGNYILVNLDVNGFDLQDDWTWRK